MNKETKQILENQKEILSYILTQYDRESPFAEGIRVLVRKTEELLSPKESPSITEKTKSALQDASRGK